MAIPLNAEADPDIHAQPTQVIKAHLDEFAAGRVSPEGLTTRLTSLCSGHSEAAWEALSLLDQYNRRGLIATDLFRSIKTAIHGVVFGSSVVNRSSSDNVAAAPAPSARNTVARRDSPQLPIDEIEEDDGDEEEDRSLFFESQQPSLQSMPRPSTATIVFDRVEPQPAEPEPPRAPPQTSAPKMRAGAVLRDRYVLIAPLGRGGMSTVFKALDRERANLPERDRYVAIKLLRDEITSRPEARAALLREFKQAQLLSHPNIVRVYDCESHGGHYFIVMELLSGELLERVLERLAPRKLRLPDAFAVIREIGVALAHAHDHGIVHGDLKPGNVMLTESGELRILDFGLSSSLLQEPWISDGLGLGTQSLIAFTPGYSSPERIRGSPPDPRDDLYSLGCIAFELVTDAAVAATGKALNRRQIMRALREVRGLSARQRRTITRALAPTRARRSPTVRAWLADFDLGHAVAHLPALRELRADDATQPRLQIWKGCLALLLLGIASALVARVFVQNVPEKPAPAIVQPAPAEDAEPSPVPGNSAPPANAGANDHANVHVTESPPFNQTHKPAAPSPALAFSDEEYTVPNTSSVARLTVKRSGSLDKETIFHWRTIGGSARAERDYVSFDDAADRFAPGQRSTQILIPIVNDLQRRGTEYFEVEITDAESATLGPVTRATVVIVSEN